MNPIGELLSAAILLLHIYFLCLPIIRPNQGHVVASTWHLILLSLGKVSSKTISMIVTLWEHRLDVDATKVRAKSKAKRRSIYPPYF